MKNLKIISLLIFFIGMLVSCVPNNQQGKEIRAGDVNSRETLKTFVFSARNYLEDDYKQAIEDFSKEGQWKYEDKGVFLIGLEEDGRVLFHSKHPQAEGVLFQRWLTGNNIDIAERLLSKGFEQGGGSEEYTFYSREKDKDLRRISYAIAFKKDGKENYLVIGHFLP